MQILVAIYSADFIHILVINLHNCYNEHTCEEHNARDNL